MTRRSMIRVLLSLLLLVSQQMAMSHVITHWSSQRVAAVEQARAADDGVSKAFAKDQLCDQCLAFAQIASAVGSETRSFAPPPNAAGAVTFAAEHRAPVRSNFPFHSRAPPVPV
jgi:hypothetical protein